MFLVREQIVGIRSSFAVSGLMPFVLSHVYVLCVQKKKKERPSGSNHCWMGVLCVVAVYMIDNANPLWQ